MFAILVQDVTTEVTQRSTVNLEQNLLVPPMVSKKPSSRNSLMTHVNRNSTNPMTVENAESSCNEGMHFLEF